MDLKSIIVAVILLALLFGWYAWLEMSERRRRRVGETQSPVHDTGIGDAQGAKRDGELWKTE